MSTDELDRILWAIPENHDGKTNEQVIDEAKAALLQWRRDGIVEAQLEHSIGILDNVRMLGEQGYSKAQILVACKKQADELAKQLHELTLNKQSVNGDDRIVELRQPQGGLETSVDTAQPSHSQVDMSSEVAHP